MILLHITVQEKSNSTLEHSLLSLPRVVRYIKY